jgi:hypothetical protein
VTRGAHLPPPVCDRHPDKITTQIAHEPPVVELLPDAGPVPADGVPPAAWPPPGATDDQSDDAAPPEPSAKQQADDELFFLRMLKPFTRYVPDTVALTEGPVRVLVGVGAGFAQAVREALAAR